MLLPDRPRRVTPPLPRPGRHCPRASLPTSPLRAGERRSPRARLARGPRRGAAAGSASPGAAARGAEQPRLTGAGARPARSRAGTSEGSAARGRLGREAAAACAAERCVGEFLGLGGSSAGRAELETVASGEKLGGAAAAARASEAGGWHNTPLGAWVQPTRVLGRPAWAVA